MIILLLVIQCAASKWLFPKQLSCTGPYATDLFDFDSLDNLAHQTGLPKTRAVIFGLWILSWKC
jgi:hypothetical protein